MPELPEVETVARDLERKITGTKFLDVWTDWPRHFSRSPGGFKKFQKEIENAKIKKIRRHGKNILIDLSVKNGERTMLVHLKMTGHLLLGQWIQKNGKWISKDGGSLGDKVNSYIHTLFRLRLTSGKPAMLAFSDVRKFGKIILAKPEDLWALPDLKLGPDALGIDWEIFEKALQGRKGPVKKVLLNQGVLAGIGNIYSDEILSVAGIHPEKRLESLSESDLRKIFNATKLILKKAVWLRGTSMSDYRDTSGERGKYLEAARVYGRRGKPCHMCGTPIERLIIGNRSAHFCPECQK